VRNNTHFGLHSGLHIAKFESYLMHDEVYNKACSVNKTRWIRASVFRAMCT
jgi:hypothetical protein